MTLAIKVSERAPMYSPMLQGCSFCSPTGRPEAPGVCIDAASQCPAGPRSIVVDSGCPSPFLPLIVGGVVLYLAAFSPGLGTVPWSVNAEIFPVQVSSPCARKAEDNPGHISQKRVQWHDAR